MRNILTFFITITFLLLSSCEVLQEFGDDESGLDSWSEDGEGAEMYGADEAYPGVKDSPYFRDFTLPLPLFTVDSAWNQRADGASVLTDSDRQVLSMYRVLLGDISTLEGYDEPATNWPYMDINHHDYTIPIFLAGDIMSDVTICEGVGELGWSHPKFNIHTEGGPVAIPLPLQTVRSAGPEDEDADGHLVLYRADTLTSYDIYAATIDSEGDCRGFQGGMVGSRITEAGVVDFFRLDGSGANADGWYSARATGTPLLAGLILPEDIERGVIAHALAFAIPGPRNTARNPYEPIPEDYFYPASTTETDFYNTDPYALAAGQRIRLKDIIVSEEGERIDESQLAPITRMFLAALRGYGAYLVDNAGGFSFYAEDVHTAVLHLSDEEIKVLIGLPPDAVLPPDRSGWQMVMDKLANELELIPLAVSPVDFEPDPESAEIEISNFEVIEPAVQK